MKKKFNYDLAQKRVELAVKVVILLRETAEFVNLILSVVSNYSRVRNGISAEMEAQV